MMFQCFRCAPSTAFSSGGKCPDCAGDLIDTGEVRLEYYRTTGESALTRISHLPTGVSVVPAPGETERETRARFQDAVEARLN